MDGQNWPFDVTLHKTIQNSSIFRQKKFTHVLSHAVFWAPCMS
jgi:hypothetical protein